MRSPKVPMAEVELQRMLVRWILIPVAAVSLLAGIWLWEISRLLSSAQWVDHADRLISQAHKVDALVIEREGALRAFLTTGRAEFLDPYRTATGQLDREFARLGALVRDEPLVQTERAAEMAGERAAWEALAAEALVGFEANPIPMPRRQAGLSAETAASMSRLREHTAAFVQTEERLRNERSRSHQHAAKLVVASSAALALLLAVVLAFAARRSLWVLSEAYRRALARAEEAVRVRDEFMSIAAHELRTPLTALNLHLEGLARGPAADDNATSRKIAAAKRQTQRLFALVDNLLDVARLTGGAPLLEREDVDLAEIARTVADRFSVACVIDGAAAIPARLDRLRVEQLLTNLISNAIKFGEHKPVELRAESHSGFAVLRVHDDGIGIPEDSHERIFGRFERAVSTRGYNGLGLGLYLARQCVEAHGGSIGVESRPGAGTTFTVLLPLGTPEAAVAPVAPEQTVH